MNVCSTKKNVSKERKRREEKREEGRKPSSSSSSSYSPFLVLSLSLFVLR
jgi:hypothetical protein